MGKITAVIAFAVVLFTAACGNGWQPSDMAAPGAIEKYTCQQATVALDKFETVTGERDPEAMTTFGITEGNKSDLRTKLEARKKACEGASPAGSPVSETAKQACGEPTVAACKKKGTEVFNSIPAERRGDTKTASAPAAFNAELQGMDDTSGDLNEAARKVNILVGFKEESDKGTPMDTAATAAQLRGLLEDTKAADVNIGSNGDHPVDWALNAQEERGAGSFSKRTLKSADEVGAFLREDTPESRALRDAATTAIKAKGYGDSEVERALSGAGYIPIQMKDASQVLGTTYFQDGKVLEAGSWRQASAGDVYWLYFTSDGRLIPEALVRADCGNINANKIRPVRPDTPPAPPVEHPPGKEVCPDGTVFHPETGTCQPPSCKVNCTTTTTTPPPCTACPKAPGEVRDQNNGGSVYGGDGTQRHTAPATAEQPKAGNPPPTYQPPAQTPTPNPVPGGTSAPPSPTQTTAVGAQPSTSYSQPCVSSPTDPC